MKGLLLSVIFSTVFGWGMEATTAAAAEKEKQCVKTVVTKTAAGNTVMVIARVVGSDESESVSASEVTMDVQIVTGEGEDGAVKIIRCIKGVPGQMAFFAGDAGGKREHLSLLSAVLEVDENSGWLGIKLGSSEGEPVGIVVLNVAKGSPASVAGFELDDIIVELDDAAIGEDIGGFVKAVGQSGPGERMKFTVVRDGAQRTLVATLGSRGDAGEIEWEYADETQFVTLDRIRSAAKVLRRGDDGEWKFETLDGDADWLNLPHDIGKLLPRFHSQTMKITIGDDDQKRVLISILRDGEGLQIETTDEGGIKVTRTDTEAGEETVRVFTNADELAANDEEAFEIYDGAKGHVMVELQHAPFGGNRFVFRIGEDDDIAHFGWLEKIEDQLQGQSGALAEAMERLKDIHVQIDLPGLDADKHSGGTFFEFLHGRAKQTIRENPDGTIDVIVRKGDNELVTRYADEDDLETRNPEAYETYQDLKAESE